MNKAIQKTTSLRSQSDFSASVKVVQNSAICDIAILIDEIVSVVDPYAILEYFGATHITNRGRYISCTCPIHKGDNPDGFCVYIHDSSGLPIFFWKCYTHNCDAEYQRNIIGFVMACSSMSFDEAVRFLCQYTGINIEDFEDDKVSISEIENRRSLSSVCRALSKINNTEIDFTKVKNPYLNEDFVARSLRRRNLYFKERGFSDLVLDTFEVGHCCPPDSPWSYASCASRAVIPIRDENFRLVGISGRAEMEVDRKIDNKYRILSGSNKSGVLYGYYLSKAYIEEKKSIILVEGFADLWKCWMAGIKNVVAVMGKKITDQQLKLILSSSHRALICFDYDNGRNEESVIQIKKTLSQFINTDIGFISIENDLGGSSVESVKDFFGNYTRYI